MKKPCDKEETLVDYLEGHLTGAQRIRLERHLADCDQCREQLAAYGVLTSDPSFSQMDPVPEALTRRAIQAVHGIPPRSSEDLIRRSLKKVQSGWQAVWGRMELMLYGAPAMVRGGRTAGGHDLVTVNKSFQDMEAAIEIEKSGADRTAIRIDLSTQAASGSPQPVRVSLLQNDREVASFLSMGKPAVFEDIPFGAYVLVFSREGDPIGEYPFEIRETRHGQR